MSVYVERISRYQLKYKGVAFAVLSGSQFTKLVETIRALDVQKLHKDGEKTLHKSGTGFGAPYKTFDLGVVAVFVQLLHIAHDGGDSDDKSGVIVRVTDGGNAETGRSVYVLLSEWPEFVAGLDNVHDGI